MTTRRLNQPVMGSLIGCTALIGLALLFATNTIFPGILVLGGIIAIIAPILSRK